MFAQMIFDRLLDRIQVGGLKVKYWNNFTKRYGPAEPYFTMTIKSADVITAILLNQSLGFGEAYMDGRLEIDGPLDQVIRLIAENSATFNRFSLTRLTTRIRPNRSGSEQADNVQHHYDLGNDFYRLWLDPTLQYSCAYFKTPTDSLELAQTQKIDHLLKKLQLERGQSVLDIGSGWGTLLITAAKRFEVRGLGITLSKEQFKHSNASAKAAGVDHLVKFELMNYQDLPSDKRFDRVISVGMFEHVRRENHRAYFKAVDRLLKPGGLSVLHTITTQREDGNDPWIDRYIFPGAGIPSTREIVKLFPEYGFRFLDYENLRLHYAMTTDKWLESVEQNADKIVKLYDERFLRMWRFYLAGSSGNFRYGDLDLGQFVFSKGINNDLPLTRDYLYH